MTAKLGYQTLVYDSAYESDREGMVEAAEQKNLNAAPFVDLVTRAQSGDDAALEQLIRDYQRRVGRMVVALVGDDSDWQDLCQQIFVKMVHGLPRLKSINVFEPWLFRIVRNACYDHLRHRRSQRYLVKWEDWHDSIAAEAPSTESEAASVALAKAIAQLPPDQRELITLMRDRQWRYESLGRMTGDSLAAIKSRLFRARQRLRQLMAAKESDNER